MVAASQPAAVSAGLSILRQGGTAADAAIATAAALAVTEPCSTGIGGDCFALYYSAHDSKVSALNGSGRSPQALDLARLARDGFQAGLPAFHAHTVTVPGACAGWCDLLERFGRLDFASVLAPAIELAENGFAVTPLTAVQWERGVERQLRPQGGWELTIEGRAPQAGEIFRNAGYARTLRQVAQYGKDGFYQGEIAEAIVQAVREKGGALTTADLAQHTSTWEEPIRTRYRHLQVWECPPNGQGLAALLALNLLEGFDLSEQSPLSPARLHLQIEAMRLAFADARWYVADPSFAKIPLPELLSKAYAAERRKQIDPTRATLDSVHGTPTSSSGTVYFCVVDGEGNACSFINSNYMGFGTGIVPRGWGFPLQNRGHNFAWQAGHPNALAGGKRPYHTIIPALLTHPDGRLWGALGVMGGFMQPQGHLQVVSALADDGLDVQSALDQARFCIEPQGSEPLSAGAVALEEGIDLACQRQLAEWGHPVYAVQGQARSLFGRGQIIHCAENGVLWGGSDPRADGCAMGF
jgi:gamma-glutamyltranspeptidase/glutathione hydrolase